MNKTVKNTSIHKLHALVSILERSADEMLNSEFNLSYSQFRIMYILNKYSLMNQKDLSNCLGLTEAAISKQIENMYIKNYLVREVDSNNRRKNVISMTNSGNEIFIAANEYLIKRSHEVFSILDQPEKEMLEKVLDKLLGQFTNFNPNTKTSN